MIPTSISFFALGVVLYNLGYPSYISTGMMLQYILSTLVWIKGCPKSVLWADRIMAVTNILFLGTEHKRRGVPASLMMLLLMISIFFWYNDFISPHYG